MKDDQEPEPITLGLESIHLGNIDNRDITSLAITSSSTGEPKNRITNSIKDMAFTALLDCYEELKAETNQLNPAVTYDQWKDEFISMGRSPKADNLSLMKTRLVSKGSIEQLHNGTFRPVTADNR